MLRTEPAVVAAMLLSGHLALAIEPSPGGAVPSTAQQLFDRGVADMLAARYDTGCAALAQSQRLDPRAGTVFTLAECFAAAGKTASAVTEYGKYLAQYETMGPEQRRAHQERAAIAQSERQRLTPLLPRIILALLESAPANVIVSMDGQPLDASAFGVPRAVDPGTHVFTVRRPDGASAEYRYGIATGETVRIVLPLPRERSSGLPSAPQRDAEYARPRSSAQRDWAYISGGVGLLGITVGAVAGALVLDRRATVRSHCEDIDSNTAECDPEGLSAASSAKTLGIVSTISFALGAVGTGTAALLLITEPSPPKRGSAKVWRIGVSSTSFDGAFVEIRGSL